MRTIQRSKVIFKLDIINTVKRERNGAFEKINTKFSFHITRLLRTLPLVTAAMRDHLLEYLFNRRELLAPFWVCKNVNTFTKPFLS